MLSRRDFLQKTSLVSLSPFIPLALSRVAHASAAGPDAKILVVIQLDGGNDGINTIVPHGDDGYGRNRESLRLKAGELHKINEHVAFHARMSAAKELFDDGRLTVIQGVGYPNPDRSHFRSMRIWQTARFDEDQFDNYGWLGRALDTQETGRQPGQSDAIYVGPDEVPVALWSRRAESVGLARMEDFKLPFAGNPFSDQSAKPGSDDSLSLFLSRQVLSAYASAAQLDGLAKNCGLSSPDYPSTQLAANLKLVSQLIKTESAARVFYTSQSGYDTHAAQLFTHSRLLNEFSEGLKAFLNDLAEAGLEDRVIVLAFSEFGRRVKENASQGTDHGTAGPVFLAGSRTVGGLIGNTPDLTDLIDGDVKFGVDMREIYATLLENWMGVEPRRVLDGSFAKLKLLQG